MTKIIGNELSNIPWQDKPKNYDGPVWRYDENPIIKKNPMKNVVRIYNSGVVPFNGKFAGVFRYEGRDGKSNLRVGYSSDAINFTFEEEKINFIDENGETYNPNYAYDPRVVEIEGVYYVMWCTDFNGAAIGLAKTTDFKTFTRLENPFIPFNRNAVLFPRKINGEYVMLSRPSDSGHTPFGEIYLSRSKDLTYWGRHRHVMSSGGSGWWQGLKIGGGPAPIETDEGWLTFYHGVSRTCNGYVYSMGVAMLDLDEPSKVLYRSKDFVLTPDAPYEETGFVPNVVFPCATLHDSKTGRIAVYYGAADSCVALAFTTVDEIVQYMKDTHELVGRDNEIGKY